MAMQLFLIALVTGLLGYCATAAIRVDVSEVGLALSLAIVGCSTLVLAIGRRPSGREKSICRAPEARCSPNRIVL